MGENKSLSLKVLKSQMGPEFNLTYNPRRVEQVEQRELLEFIYRGSVKDDQVEFLMLIR
jgi:hypothetical protein